MSASSSLEDEVYEYRLLIATAATLVCCAVLLIAATLIVTTGDRFEFRPASSHAANTGDNLVSAFETLQAMAARKAASLADPAQERRASSEHAATGSSCAASQGKAFCSKACPFGAESPVKRPIVVRLKSPWCSGALRHQPFHACRPRPR